MPVLITLVVFFLPGTLTFILPSRSTSNNTNSYSTPKMMQLHETNIEYSLEDYKLNHANTTDERVKKYLEDGYVIIRNVLDTETIKQASAHVQWLQQQVCSIHKLLQRIFQHASRY